MKYKTTLTLSLITIIFGWILSGFGFTTKLGHPISTICFLTGLLMILFGVIFFIKTIREK